MDLLTPMDGWVLNDAGSLLVTGDGGHSWSNVTPSVGGHGLEAAFFISPAVGWLAVGEPARPNAPVSVMQTVDGGKSWVTQGTLMSAAPHTSLRLNFTDGNHGSLLAGQGNAGPFDSADLFMTSDGGRSWQRSPAPVDGEARFDGSWGTLVGRAGRDERLYSTSNSGGSWSVQQLSAPASTSGLEVMQLFPPRSLETANSTLSETWRTATQSGVSFYASSDHGSSWNLVGSLRTADPSTFDVSAAQALDARTWRVATSHMLYETVDGGQRWTRTRVSTALDPTRIDFASAASGWVLGSKGACAGYKTNCTYVSHLFSTTDGGHSWRLLTPS